MRQPPLRTNHVKAALNAGQVVIGTWIVMNRHPGIVRMAAASGLDFVFIDTEHSDFSWETVATLCEMARACDLVPIVRPPDTNPHRTNRLQDIGAMGLMYHDVTERSEVDAFLSAMRYPPLGTRGSASFVAAMDYRSGKGEELRDTLNESAMLVIQVESARGVDNLDAILAGGGVDLVEVGRGDLSASLGLPMQPRHPTVLAALDDVIRTCDRHGVAVGVNCLSVEDGRDMLDRGVRCLSYSNDRKILLNAYAEAVESLGDHAGRIASAKPARQAS